MHNPTTLAHKIRFPLHITIWHVDTEQDGSDDSCGWFMSSRHCDREKLLKIANQFEFEWNHGVPNGWFDEDGDPNYSCQAITIGMFRIAANIHFGHWSRRADRFLRRNIFNILAFAENNCDSLYTFITRPYGKEKGESVKARAMTAAEIIYPWICRADRPWWKHPKWHFWHWKIQIHFIQQLKRRFWDKCSVCGKRGFPPGVGYIANWEGTQIRHSNCRDN